MGKNIVAQKADKGRYFSCQFPMKGNRCGHRNKRIIGFSFIILMFFALAPVFADDPPDRTGSYAAGEVLVKIRMNSPTTTEMRSPAPTLEPLNRRFGALRSKTLFTFQPAPRAAARADSKASAVSYQWHRISFPPDADLELIAQAYRDDPEVEDVQLNYVYHMCATPNDPYFSSSGSWGQNYDDLWDMKKMQAEQAWDISTGSRDVAVAVVDSGVDTTHEDLQGNLWTNPEDGGHGWNFITASNAADDDNGHGTHVAGIIGAVGNNGKGVVGVNWRCQIMAIKVLNQYGTGLASDISEGIVWATDHGARVINLSLGGDKHAPVMWDAIAYAHSKNCVVVAAAGNNAGDVTYFYPAAYADVITVASTDQNDMRSSFSNYGAKIEVAAPGGGSTDENDMINFTYLNVLSLRAANTDMYAADGLDGIAIVGERYYRSRGTSMAAPHVAGLAALMLAHNPNLTNEEVRAILEYSADDIDAPGWDEDTGYGRINAFQSLQRDSAPLLAHMESQRFKPIIGYSPLTIRGTAGGSEFVRYEISMKSLGSGQEEVLATASSAVVDGALGTLNIPLSYPEGDYLLTLSVYSHDRVLHDSILIELADVVSGWPQELESATDIFPLPLNLSPLAVADSGSRNGKIIVAADGDRNIYVWKADGTPYNAHWPKPSLGARQSAGSNLYPVYTASPAVGDVNGDHRPEIVYCCDRQIHVFNLEDASELPGWPKSVDEDISAWALASLNHGCKKQVVVTTTAAVHVFDENGKELPGWPAAVLMPNDILAAADLNGDGKDDIIVASQGDASTVVALDSCGKRIFETELISGIKEIAIGNVTGNTGLEVVVYSQSTTAVSRISIYDHTGHLHNSWVIQDGISGAHFTFLNYSLSLGDISGNPFVQEIIVSEYTYDRNRKPITETSIFVYTGAGALVEGWPLNFAYKEISSCFVADINHDYRNEVIVVSQRAGSSPGIITVDVYTPGGGPYGQGWPKRLYDYGPSGDRAKCCVTVADMNSDGQLELLGACGNSVYAFNLRGSAVSGGATWPMPMHDPEKTRAIIAWRPWFGW